MYIITKSAIYNFDNYEKLYFDDENKIIYLQWSEYTEDSRLILVKQCNSQIEYDSTKSHIGLSIVNQMPYCNLV